MQKHRGRSSPCTVTACTPCDSSIARDTLISNVYAVGGRTKISAKQQGHQRKSLGQYTAQHIAANNADERLTTGRSRQLPFRHRREVQHGRAPLRQPPRHIAAANRLRNARRRHGHADAGGRTAVVVAERGLRSITVHTTAHLFAARPSRHGPRLEQVQPRVEHRGVHANPLVLPAHSGQPCGTEPHCRRSTSRASHTPALIHQHGTSDYAAGPARAAENARMCSLQAVRRTTSARHERSLVGAAHDTARHGATTACGHEPHEQKHGRRAP